jgi:Rrf2 family cysteine metabolism transcriptional repressor
MTAIDLLTPLSIYDSINIVDQNSQQKVVTSVRFSTRARYGTKALLELALHDSEKPVPLKYISQRQQIPLPYLEHLISPLVQAGIVKSTRGIRGGVSLLRPPQQVLLSEVIQLLEGSIAPVACVDNPGACPHSKLCVTRDLWDEVREAISRVLDSVTLQDLVERKRQEAKP